MFGRSPQIDEVVRTRAYDPLSHQGSMRKKIAELQDFVETNMASSAQKQANQYDKTARMRTFKVGDRVWLSVPTAGKLEPKWEGEWTIASKKNAVNYEISDGVRNRIVHVNRLKQRIQPNVQRLHLQQDNQPVCQQWNPPSIDHIIESTDTPTPRYSTRNRRPPVRYGQLISGGTYVT